MTDTRIRVPLNGKVPDLALLDAETGGHGLCASGEEVVAVEGSPVTADELAAAVAAHEPPNSPAAVPVEDRIAALEAEIRGMKDRAAVEAAKASPTAKGVAQAVASGG